MFAIAKLSHKQKVYQSNLDAFQNYLHIPYICAYYIHIVTQITKLLTITLMSIIVAFCKFVDKRTYPEKQHMPIIISIRLTEEGNIIICRIRSITRFAIVYI